jgi:6-pyruvoyltetrahydropterin/6-carboxytetrahydropterin synthase
MIVRITKEFSFEMAHQLDGYDGLCRNIHGHSYRLLVTVSGTPAGADAGAKRGMVMDFTDLKKIVHERIVDAYDHALMLRQGSSADEALKSSDTKLLRVSYQPTCENMLVRIVEALSGALPKHIVLRSIRLYETATSYAEWHAADNAQIF